jgi:protein transport protein SEC61 subunit gamma-like protein
MNKRYIDTLLIPAMDPKRTLRNMANTMKLAKKSDKDDYMQHLRLVLLGIATVGAIGFIIQFVFSVITFG